MTKSFITKTRWLVTIILLLSLSVTQMWGADPNWTGTSSTKAPAGTYKAMVSSEIVALGDTILIVYENGNSSKAMSTTQNTNNRGTIGVSVSSSTITLDGTTAVQAWTVGASDVSGSWTLRSADGYLYAPSYASSTSNYIRTFTGNKDKAGGDWKIAYDSIVANGAGTRRRLRYNSSNNPPIMSCYNKDAQTAITVYKKAHTISYNANGGSTTCSDATLYKSNANVTVCATEPTRANYNFTGWTANVDVKNASTSATITAGTLIAAGTTIVMPAKFVVLTAQWEAAASCTTNPTVSAGSLKGSVSSSSEATAQCTGGITSLGSAGCSITSYGFAVGTSTNPTIGGTLTGTGKTYQVGTTYTTTSTAFEKLIDGLSASTKYYVRPYATNGNGTAYGTEFNFTTLAACTTAPTVTAGSTGTITKSTAVVNCSSGITSLGTGGCSITSYGFAYGTSTNPTISGTKVEVGTSYTTTSTSFTATLTDLTEGQTYYVRPYATNGYGTAYGDQVTFGTPKITVDPAGLVVAFGDKKVGGTYTETFTVSGVNLQGNITLTPSAGCSGIFSIDKTSITPTSGSVTNEVITITYTPTTAGIHGGGSVYINVESSNAQTRSVMPTGTGKWEVTWSNNGSTSTTLVANSTKPDFPSTPSSCDGTSTTFIGWATAPWTGKIASLAGKTVHTAASTMDAVTANGTTYYAVFAKAGESTTTFKRVQTLSDLNTASKIAIVNAYSKSNYILTTDLATAQTAPTENGSGQISVSSGQYWTLEKSSTNWKFKKDATNYLKGDANPTSSEKQKTISTGTSGNMTWVITTNSHTGNGTPVFTIRNASSDYAGLEYSGGWCLYYATDFNTSWYTLKLYVPDVSYSDYLTTCCEYKVALSAGSPSNGTVVFSPAGPIATCSSTAGDRQTTVTVTPAAGYKLTGWAKAVSGISLPDSTSAISTSYGNTAAQSNTYTFAQNANGSMAVTATFTAMVDHYKDLLHSTSGYTGDGHSESATYTVPALSNASDPADDSCEELHYKFVGWVEESYVKSDGTLNSGYTLITGGSAGTASDKTYIAIWAKEL